MRTRTAVLETAILGLLHQGPLHGYELRKQLNVTLGPFRPFSYGSLYPALKSLATRHLITEADIDTTRSRRRARIAYELTESGHDYLHHVLSSANSSAWEDDNFDVRFAFFRYTDANTRLRILEGRRTRMAERLDALRESVTRTRERLDEYTLELQRHGLEHVEREVHWLDGLIISERNRIHRDESNRERSPQSAEPSLPGQSPDDDPAPESSKE